MKPPIPAPNTSPVPQPAHVLIVEDELGFATAVCLGLRASGYLAQIAGSVGEALAILEKEPVDLLIVDWSLPDGSGAQVCQAARISQPSIPIIVITAMTNMHDSVIRDCQPNFYLTKPLSLVQLFSNVRALVN